MNTRRAANQAMEKDLEGTGISQDETGVLRALEGESGQPLVIPPEPQIIGALGAALLAMDDLPSTA